MPVDDMWFYRDGSKKSGHGKGKRWRARWPNPHAPRKHAESYQRFAKKSDAEKHAAEMVARVNAGEPADPRLGRVTLAAVADEWLAARFGVHGRSTEKVERHLRLHITPLLGHHPVGKVTPSVLKAWVADRSQHLQPGSLRGVWVTLHAVLEAAADDGRIARNPCDKVEVPAGPDRGAEKVIPTTGEVLALADAVPPRYRALVWLAAGCGLRLGEIAGLEPGDVAWLSRPPTITVARQIMRERGQVYVDDPKSQSSLRTVETDAAITQVVAEHMRLFPPRVVEMADETAAANPRRRPGEPPARRGVELLFATATGKPLSRGEVSRKLSAAVAVVGADPRITMHSLRHYYASVLFARRVSEFAIQRQLGHATVRQTMATYVHFRPDGGASAASAMGAEFADAAARRAGGDGAGRGGTGS